MPKFELNEKVRTPLGEGTVLLIDVDHSVITYSVKTGATNRNYTEDKLSKLDKKLLVSNTGKDTMRARSILEKIYNRKIWDPVDMVTFCEHINLHDFYGDEDDWMFIVNWYKEHKDK